MLNSVDLFSGIGGFSFAFRDLFAPMCYCDNDADAVRILKALMNRGVLQTAPVVDDVSSVGDIVAAVGGRRVHLLTAGFPCVGFSKRGRREGFGNKHSAMFFKTLDVIRAVSPSMVMFENVAEILTFDKGASVRVIWDKMRSLGFSMRWTTCSANDVGKPHLRNRWFCLCCKGAPVRLKDIRNLFPSRIAAPELIARDQGPNTSQRLFALGNAIVPMAATMSFSECTPASRSGTPTTFLS